MNYSKVSSLIKSQLPNFIVDDINYSNFVSFLEAYYEWMELKGNVNYESKHLLNYLDIDNTLDEFIQYFYSEFLPDFPTNIVADKRKLIQFSKDFYQRKGTINSFKFLFKVLYNSECEIFEMKDEVLKTSSGKWYVPKSIKINSTDTRFLHSIPYYVYGIKSGTVAKIEDVKISRGKIEIYLSDIERNFSRGEPIKIIDFYGNDVILDNSGNITTSNTYTNLTGTLVSSISSIVLDKNNRGSYYNAGNPVVFYGGFSNNIIHVANRVPAKAKISKVRTGSIKSVSVNKTIDSFDNNIYAEISTPYYYNFDYRNPLYGYRAEYTAVPAEDLDKTTLIKGNSVYTKESINMNYIVQDSIDLYANVILNADLSSGYVNIDANTNYGFNSNVMANANSTMSDVFTFTSFDTYKIRDVKVLDGGSGYTTTPKIKPISMYKTTQTFANTANADPRYNFDKDHNLETYQQYYYTPLSDLGILSPIKILNGGKGFVEGDEIIFSGGLGVAAYANVTTVNTSGTILRIDYYQKPNIPAPLGGFGWDKNNLPIVNVRKDVLIGSVTNGSNIFVPSSPFDNVFVVGHTITGNGLDSSNTLVTSYTSGNLVLSQVATSSNSGTYIVGGVDERIFVTGIMGGSASLEPMSDDIGQIESIEIEDYGDGYDHAPSVFLDIQDYVISNVNPSFVPRPGDFIKCDTLSASTNTIYFEVNNVSTVKFGDGLGYNATIDSVTKLYEDSDPYKNKYLIRTFDYGLSPVDIRATLTIEKYDTNDTYYGVLVDRDHIFPKNYWGIPEQTVGVVTFGDGKAMASSKYSNGLMFKEGKYLDKYGQLSSYNALQSMEKNDFTYVLSLNKEFTRYKDILYKLIHPAGTQVIGQVNLENEIELKPDLLKSPIPAPLDFEILRALPVPPTPPPPPPSGGFSPEGWSPSWDMQWSPDNTSIEFVTTGDVSCTSIITVLGDWTQGNNKNVVTLQFTTDIISPDMELGESVLIFTVHDQGMFFNIIGTSDTMHYPPDPSSNSISIDLSFSSEDSYLNSIEIQHFNWNGKITNIIY